MNRAAVAAGPAVAAGALPTALLAVVAAVLLAGCGTNQPTASVAGRTDTTTATTANGLGTPAPPASFGPPPSPSPPDEATPIAIEPALLLFLPASIDGTPVTEDLDVAAAALADGTITEIATGIDAAVAVDTGSGNLVTAWVVRLRSGAFGDELYRQWRDTYDEGACAAAGGIVGRAQAELGGRNTYVTSCVAALRTYHVWLEEQNVLISVSSIGEGRFGEKLMSTLRLPE